MITLVMGLITMISLGQQYVKVPDKSEVYDSIRQEYYYRDYGYKRILIEEITNTPGSELNLYVKHHYRGITFSLLGGVITGFGLYMYNTSTTYHINNPGTIYENVGVYHNSFKEKGGVVFITTGTVLSIIGMVYIFEAPIHIKRASILLNENGVGIKVKL